MGGFFGAISKKDCVLDVFFGVDYHSHLGTRYAGLAFYDPKAGFSRQIHSIDNTPFRTKFEKDIEGLHAVMGIGCIIDYDPEPLMVRSKLGLYAIAVIGSISNAEALANMLLKEGRQQFMPLSSGRINSAELTAMLINEKASFAEGIRYAQEQIEGAATILILTDHSIIAARDLMGRLPVMVGENENGYCVSFESFACQKLDYSPCRELRSGEVVEITANGVTTLLEGKDEMKICAFLWAYYGYPNSNYEGVNVEVMRCRNGEIMACSEMESGTLPDIDYVAGVPDSGIPHAIGYANMSKQTFARPFIKYTPTWPRSYMPGSQAIRDKIATMKQIPVAELIQGKKLLFVDDSIVRGTQLRSTVDFLYENGAKEVHMRSACPPIMYPCKYLNRPDNHSEMELITRRTIHDLEGEEGARHIDEYADKSTKRGRCMLQRICDQFGFDSLGYQTLDGLLEAIGLDKQKICTYCWTGKE